MKVYNTPGVAAAQAGWRDGLGGGVNHQIAGRGRWLAKLGVEYITVPMLADIVQVEGPIPTEGRFDVDVFVVHCVYATPEFPDAPQFCHDQNALQAELARQAGRVVATSRHTARRIVEQLGVEREVTVLPDAIDPQEIDAALSAFDWRAHFGMAPLAPLFVWGKNVIDALRKPDAALEIARRWPGATVAITASAEALAPWNPPANVRAVGLLPWGDMLALLRAADALLVTTLEAAGAQHLEAMYLRTPVVGYAWGGAGEVVRHGSSGFLVEPGNVDWLSEGLDWAIANAERAGRSARRAALAYDWRRVAPQWLGLYEDLATNYTNYTKG